MTKSQNTKNEQQKDLCITSEQLTEQWKKGELPSGWYYTKLWKGCNVIDYFIGNQFLRYDDSDIVEVIALVPTFDELQNMNKAVNECMAANIKLVEQNKQLKEQINKWCLDAINRGTANTVKAVKEFGIPERIKELVEQNAQLKELLKECQLLLKYLPIDDYDNKGLILDEKIDEALR